MIELLEQLGLPVVSILFVVTAIAILREVWSLLIARRSAASQQIIARTLDYIDRQLSEFYLPLSARLRLTEHVYAVTRTWVNSETLYFDNAAIDVVSDDARALSKIVVRRLFLPLNTATETTILSNLNLKHPDDTADYQALLAHIVMWRAFEEAEVAGDIRQYSGSSFLTFPSDVATVVHQMTQRLVAERDSLYHDLMVFRAAEYRLWPRRRTRGSTD